MAIAELKGDTVTAKLWAPIHEIESGALDQIRNVSSLPWSQGVSIMPDVHQGIGCTIGTVLASKDAAVPAVVGVDPGCGMEAVMTNIRKGELKPILKDIYEDLVSSIPTGFTSHSELCDVVKGNREYKELLERVEEHPVLNAIADGTKYRTQLGTLGGGNHFIELCSDQAGHIWMLLHSGSRNLGKSVADYFMAQAKKLEHNQQLTDRNLSAFIRGEPGFDSYWRCMKYCQDYAAANRRVMMSLFLRVLERHLTKVDTFDRVSCHHNYIEEEEHNGEKLLVARKGAIRAGKGERGIIPGAMGKDARSYIVTGLGNEESYLSAPHGAGRAMSRGEAKRRFTVSDLEEVTQGIVCKKDKSVLDEIQGAYKPIKTVMEHASDLVEVNYELQALLCVKG